MTRQIPFQVLCDVRAACSHAKLLEVKHEARNLPHVMMQDYIDKPILAFWCAHRWCLSCGDEERISDIDEEHRQFYTRLTQGEVVRIEECRELKDYNAKVLHYHEHLNVRGECEESDMLDALRDEYDARFVRGED